MASTYPIQGDIFPGAPYTDGIEFVLAAYANFWISCITALENTIGFGASGTAANPLFSSTFSTTYSTITARIANIESTAVNAAKIDTSAGDIVAVGTSALAGAVGKSADSGHRHVGVASITATAPITASASSGAVTIAFSGTAMTTATYDGAGIAQQVVGTSATQTISNKRITHRVVSVTQSATPTINTNNADQIVITGLAQNITSMTTNLSGTPVAGDLLMICITDNGATKLITWGASFASSSVTLPAGTLTGGQILTVGFRYSGSVWVCIGVA